MQVVSLLDETVKLPLHGLCLFLGAQINASKPLAVFT